MEIIGAANKLTAIALIIACNLATADSAVIVKLEEFRTLYQEGGFKEAVSLVKEEPVLASMEEVQYLMFEMYGYGLGTEKDSALAISWLMKGVHSNYSPAIEQLKNIYRYGEFGFPKNRDFERYLEGVAREQINIEKR